MSAGRPSRVCRSLLWSGPSVMVVAMPLFGLGQSFDITELSAGSFLLSLAGFTLSLAGLVLLP